MKKVILIYLIFFGILVFNIGCQEVKSVHLMGKIKVKGTEPHTYLVIKDEGTKKDYKIENYKEFELQKKQNKRIQLEAEILEEAIGAGLPTVVKIIKIN